MLVLKVALETEEIKKEKKELQDMLEFVQTELKLVKEANNN